MARPREFDIDEALGAAMQAFWDHGYEGTSVKDLMQAMRLEKGSVYKAFGNKRNLFLLALRRYLDQALEGAGRLLRESKSPLEGIRDWLTEFVMGLCCDQDLSRGCLAINSVVELGPHDQEVSKMIQAQFRSLNRLIAEAAQRGQRNGEIRRDHNAETLAEFVTTTACGLLAMSNGKLPRARGLRIVAFAMSALAEK